MTLQSRHAVLASRARLEAMRGGNVAPPTARVRLVCDEGTDLQRRLHALAAGFVAVDRASTIYRYLCVDVAIVGSNALLAAVACDAALRRRFTVLLGAEPRLVHVPDGVVRHLGFALWLDRLLALDSGRVVIPGLAAPTTVVAEAARAFSHWNSRDLLARPQPDALVMVTDKRLGAETMLTVFPGKRAAPDSQDDAASARLLSAFPTAGPAALFHPGTATAVFARRVVACGLSPALAPWKMVEGPNGSVIDSGNPNILPYGSAKAFPRSDGAAVERFMLDLEALSAGRHLDGLEGAAA